jgi:hypothetical protein
MMICSVGPYLPLMAVKTPWITVGDEQRLDGEINIIDNEIDDNDDMNIIVDHIDDDHLDNIIVNLVILVALQAGQISAKARK